MKFAFLKNGNYELQVSGGDEIDTAILEAMAARAKENPNALRLKIEHGVAVFSVERQ